MDDVTDIINNIFIEWKKEYNYTRRQINNGECLEFANEVITRQSNVEMMRTGDVLGYDDQYDVEPFHVWVYDGQYHYDVEEPDGVEEWNELPFFKRCGF